MKGNGKPLVDRRPSGRQPAARGLDWPRVNEMRHWARTEGWGFTSHEQVPMILAMPAYQHLKRSAVYEVLMNQAWRDPQYVPGASWVDLVRPHAEPATPGILLWIFLWALAVRRLTGGLQVPHALGGSTYYEGRHVCD